MRPAERARVLVFGARAPVALAIGCAFEAANFEAHFVDSVPSLMVRWSAFGAERLHRVRPPRSQFGGFREDVRALTAALDPLVIIPTCEEVFYLSQAAHLDRFEDLLFAPTMGVLRRLHSKFEFAELARGCGLQPPATWRVTSQGQLQSFESRGRDMVFKPEFSRFGSEVLIRPTIADLTKLRPTPNNAWVVQEFVEGEEVSVWSAAHNGRLLASSGYSPKWHFGRASSYFERDDDPLLIQMCRKLAAASGLTGQLSVDLIRAAGGKLRPIECNPRAVSGVQLFAGDARLARALTQSGSPFITPEIDTCHVGPAFWAAAATHVLRSGRLDQVVRDARRSREVLTQNGGAQVTVGAILDFARFAFKAFKASRSSTQESTADIEWNGEAIQ